MTASTFADALARELRSAPARPLVTFYDDATGERVELSVVTYANWVSKTAGLVQDELDVERGGLVLVDLPTHWLGAVWLGAAWSGGLCVTADRSLQREADLVVCGPDGVDRYAAASPDMPVVAISLRPLGARFAHPLPEGVTDYGAVVLAQPDTFVPYDPPLPADPAWRGNGTVLDQAGLLAGCAADPRVTAGGRLLTDVNPCTGAGLGTLVSPLLEGASTVWVANPDETLWDRRHEQERATTQLRATPSS
ncbi:MAG TPA: TIGR03089 family protein [Nocardioidaceae bacterium]|nr:TIGR03089 family protein [Nocardioidaceae bacterium]